jgi:hypothetical protein
MGCLADDDDWPTFAALLDCLIMDVMCVPPFDFNPPGKAGSDARTQEKKEIFDGLYKEHELLQDYFANAAVLFVNDGEFDAFVGDELKSFRTKNKIRTKPEREHPLRDYAA